MPDKEALQWLYLSEEHQSQSGICGDHKTNFQFPA